jgi:hypothetical protein
MSDPEGFYINYKKNSPCSWPLTLENYDPTEESHFFKKTIK